VAFHGWNELVAPNLDALTNVFLAAVQCGVRRIIYASSNHVMGGYKDDTSVTRITTDLPPRPGTRYLAGGQPRDSTAYGAMKLFGERLGRSVAQAHGISVLAVRLGWILPGENRPEDLADERGPWFRQMWISNRDFCHLMDCCLSADISIASTPFAILHGMSRNQGMRWDLSTTSALVGYDPQDDVSGTNAI
jgi:uronate dehydrogenase